MKWAGVGEGRRHALSIFGRAVSMKTAAEDREESNIAMRFRR